MMKKFEPKTPCVKWLTFPAEWHQIKGSLKRVIRLLTFWTSKATNYDVKAISAKIRKESRPSFKSTEKEPR